jgi:hypothetical protein
MKVVECELIEDCLAPKRVGKSVKKKGFRVGQRVRGTVTNVALTPDSQVLALKTKDGYIIPEPFLNILGEVKPNQKSSNESKTQYDVGVEEANYEEVDEPKSENKSVANIFNSLKASDIVNSNAIKSKRVVNFALGGAAVGLVYAMMKGKSKLMIATIGAIGGGVIGNYVGKKIKENGKK